jgi:hypothetical protein
MSPFGICQVAWIPQFAPVISAHDFRSSTLTTSIESGSAQ